MQYWESGYANYVEPFMGSACLFLAISPLRGRLNDLNANLVNTFRTIVAHPREVYDRHQSMPRSRSFYYKLRPRAFDTSEPIEAAANFLYLNRNCFNGLFRTNKLGGFNVPFSASRTGTLASWDEFSSASRALKRAVFSCLDFEEFIRREVRAKDFVYLDPPYAVRNRRIFNQYGPDTFGTSDLQRLSKILHLIDARRAAFVLSYANCKEAKDLFAEWKVTRVSTVRNISGFAAHRKTAGELIITNI
jgi:DNA adenine methylase